ncbi:hypothetical protein ABIB57_005393 [Devosia sp. UYZn731]|uniref:DUF6894 family protein n=1 Tax=Devosia sp. UYZn731 TaxID=3156345 RepID=UPI00339158C6
MPKFFFDIVENDKVSIDHDGIEFDDRQQAHREAVKTIAAIAAEEIPKDGKLELTVAVADESHHVLFKTHVRFEPGDPNKGE